jgi:hypothetical protein
MNPSKLFVAAFFLACGTASSSSQSDSINTGSGQPHRGNGTTTSLDDWTKTPVVTLAEVPKGAVDSVITVHRNHSGELSVIYAFNNPCQETFDAFVRRDSISLNVRFLVHETPEHRAEPMPICPAMELLRAYQIVVAHDAVKPLIIRTFVSGDGKNWSLIRENHLEAQ